MRLVFIQKHAVALRDAPVPRGCLLAAASGRLGIRVVAGTFFQALDGIGLSRLHGVVARFQAHAVLVV